MKTKTYTTKEMKSLLESMSGIYDLARVVDPIECRILEFHDDGRISLSESCYGIWNSERKCVNCSSAAACRTGCRQEKDEFFQDKVFHIQSNPVTLELADGGTHSAVVELVNIASGAPAANDRAAENVDHMAARYEALHDELTKALNAGAFYELSRERILKAPDAAWVMVTGNIMNFRFINTLFGILKGNEVLLRTGAMLRQIADASQGLCGRLSGDRFALLLPRPMYREEALIDVARSLSKAFSSGIYTFHIHFGVYVVEDASIPVSVMCDRANAALRTIRDDMKKTVAAYDDAMMRRSLFEQEIISRFDVALRGGEFKLYLQPLVGKNGGIYGAEALVRWRRADGTMIMPGDFIETLETAGLIHELDVYIWEQAVRQLSLWKGTDMGELTISVNMSAKDFFNVDVYEVLLGLIAKYRVDSRMLRLEITETALLEDSENSNAIVAKLRDAGFLVEIDDFGKGYSSLGMLKDIHADVLKIDMGLLREIENKQRSRIILESVINMANSLGMEVITEGVETEAQIETLSMMGCQYYQGFYFSRPLPVEAFERMYRAAREEIKS